MNSQGLGAVLERPAAIWDQRKILWLLVKRDLKIRYAESFLGYLWSILDPLMMAVVYWFVFTQIFPRSVGDEPYIVFLLTALLPWTWFSLTVGDAGRAIRNESRLVRSTRLPREVWALRVVISKFIEFLLSIPVLAVFAIVYQAEVNRYLWLFVVGIAIQFVLLTGIALIVAPLEVLLRDIDPLIGVILRVLFYASPILYGIGDVYSANLPGWVEALYLCNPMSGIITAFRAGFFADQLHWDAIITSAVVSLVVFVIGWVVFVRLERSVLKEL